MDVQHLPDDLVGYIREFVRPEWFLLTCKASFERHHPLQVAKFQRRREHVKRFREVIRRDMHYVFSRYVEEQCLGEWLRQHNVVYGRRTFGCMVNFVRHFCAEQDAPRCSEIMQRFLELHLQEVPTLKALSLSEWSWDLPTGAIVHEDDLLDADPTLHEYYEQLGLCVVAGDVPRTDRNLFTLL